MNKIVITVHGGAGPDSELIRNNKEGYKKGLEAALMAGYEVLEKGGRAVDAVEEAVKSLEDNPLFNAGRGSALNAIAEVEMGASIMDGSNLKCGAAAIVKSVKNPVSLAKAVMEKSKHIYLAGPGALNFAKAIKLPLQPDSYFITEHSFNDYYEKKTEEEAGNKQETKSHGTVGAVALDRDGNVAAATSTGGTEYKLEGRVADSSMVGVGVYANNKTCAISCTGDGEYMMQYVAAYDISALMEYKGMTVDEACNHLIHTKCKDVEGDMGLLAVDADGNVSMQYNSDRMHRGVKTSDGEMMVKTYEE